MRVLILGEGANEEAALPTLVQRLNDIIRDQQFRRFNSNPKNKFHGQGDGLFKKAVRWMIDARASGFDGVIMLIDHDNDRTRPRQMSAAQDFDTLPPLPPRACGVAIRTFDAWFLTDERALTKLLNRPVARLPDPEGLTDPKARVDQLMANSPYATRSDLYAGLVESMNLGQVRARCSRGFAPFAERVEALGGRR